MVVLAAMLASSAQVKPLWPWTSSQGWKWSLISTTSKPALSASTAWRTISFGSKDSVASL